MQVFISGRVSRCGSEAHVVIGAPRPVAGSARGEQVCHVEIRWKGTIVRLRPRPGSMRVALDNALGEVTEHLGIDLSGLLAHVAIGPAVHEPTAW
ncbi:hypothetical protein KHQ06_26395 [Nocardia tengchongensis]|uniref:Asp23/Gls24 family envelope stress response protein n=1 Tax=Nocardia tengchongensis TaxID=2055889 RepID=A0ABX8CKI0_9NOCA|nr:hypothetical protein [Nocardia tengchongensis]QVI19831.1 hypothetical protein KHQ06_26395 [Nocardia tengchongensis]